MFIFYTGIYDIQYNKKGSLCNRGSFPLLFSSKPKSHIHTHEKDSLVIKIIIDSDIPYAHLIQSLSYGDL